MTKETTTPSSNHLVKIVVGLWAGVGLGVILIGILVWTGVIPLLGVRVPNPETNEAPLARLEEGTPVPDVEMAHLDGTPMSMADYRGKVVVMNFWATWCGPCVQEMPMFQAYQDQYPEMVILGVDSGEDPAQVKEFLSQLQISYPTVIDDPDGMGKELRVSFLPTTIFIDEQGEIRFRHYGVISPDQMDHYLQTLGVIAE